MILPAQAQIGRRGEGKQLFPRALVECIRDARNPDASQVAVLAEKFWLEAIAWGNLGTRELAERMARVALAGEDAAS